MLSIKRIMSQFMSCAKLFIPLRSPLMISPFKLVMYTVKMKMVPKQITSETGILLSEATR
jgi:hypothetical protein